MYISTKRFLFFVLLVSVMSFISFGQTTLSIQVSKTDAKCNGNANGSATAVASGGTGSFTYNWLPTGGTNATATNLAVGTYTVIATDSVGNTIQDTISINQPPPLTVNIDSIIVQPCFRLGGGGACGCNNTLWAVVSGGTAPYRYLWTPNGQTTDTIFHVCYILFGVTVTDTNNCTASNSLNVVLPPQNTGTDTTSSTAGIANYNTGFADIKLYPVPAGNQLNVNLNKPAMQTRIEIYNMLGTKVMEQKVNDGVTLSTLDISALADGYYLFKITGAGGQKTIRFSKNNK
jgi:hypothetical protein